MASENPTWRAPKIHGELLMLGFNVSERTISRYLPRRETDPERVQKWKTFLRNHRDVIAAMDFSRFQLRLFGPFAFGSLSAMIAGKSAIST